MKGITTIIITITITDITTITEKKPAANAAGFLDCNMPLGMLE